MQNKSIYDKATQSWFSLHPCSETTVMKCSKCGLLYKPSLGHKCMATKGNFQNHKHEVADIMQKVLDLDRVVRKEGAENDNK